MLHGRCSSCTMPPSPGPSRPDMAHPCRGVEVVCGAHSDGSQLLPRPTSLLECEWSACGSSSRRGGSAHQQHPRGPWPRPRAARLDAVTIFKCGWWQVVQLPAMDWRSGGGRGVRDGGPCATVARGGGASCGLPVAPACYSPAPRNRPLLASGLVDPPRNREHGGGSWEAIFFF